ncbi:hypothetical protein OPV22_031490 [Ensete ventricosum]|uniref:Uncharacterized protein n=1 Tax=Ensete ventricosum TaxID=4639 RepID=A0AAV8PWN0_ENSVE|nr:hypothetical protein OPV22_031490 [Ensete ventricosum]
MARWAGFGEGPGLRAERPSFFSFSLTASSSSLRGSGIRAVAGIGIFDHDAHWLFYNGKISFGTQLGKSPLAVLESVCQWISAHQGLHLAVAMFAQSGSNLFSSVIRVDYIIDKLTWSPIFGNIFPILIIR